MSRPERPDPQPLRRSARGLAAAALVVGLPLGSAQAVEPAALVEDIAAPSVDLAFMDFVYPGMEIQLGAGERLTLSYLRSCVVEEISGSRVTVGERESRLAGGSVTRSEVECDGGGIVPTERQGQDVAGLVFRNRTADGQPIPVHVFAVSPIFTFSQPVQTLDIELKDPGFYETYQFPVTGGYVDLAKEKVALRQDGIYWARAGGETILFKIDRNAGPPGAKVVGRLVGF